MLAEVYYYLCKHVSTRVVYLWDNILHNATFPKNVILLHFYLNYWNQYVAAKRSEMEWDHPYAHSFISLCIFNVNFLYCKRWHYVVEIHRIFVKYPDMVTLLQRNISYTDHYWRTCASFLCFYFHLHSYKPLIQKYNITR